jgi:nicotinamidase-related amidase
MSVCLLAIDPQVDFCEGGKLPVAGATKDLERLAKMVTKWGKDLDDIQITLDSHYHIHIAHSCVWIDRNGKHPDPYVTVISSEDVEKGVWRPVNPEWLDWCKHYTKELERNHRYQLRIWTDHCIIGSIGQTIQPAFLEAVTKWEVDNNAMAPRTTKGSCPFTEHFSAVRADVVYPKDKTTLMNSDFVGILKKYDTILISGEALSHCVNFTITDVAAEFSEDQIKKFVLLEDASSSVPTCESLGQAFVDDMVKRGMKISRTDTFFK